MSTIQTEDVPPSTSESLLMQTSIKEFNNTFVAQEAKQSSTTISANMLPSMSAAANSSSCCHSTMSNSSSQLDLFVETPSMDTSSITMCESSNAYVNAGVLDLSTSGLEKLNRAAPDDVLNTTTLLLDGNCLQRLDNIHTYQCLEKLSAENNRLVRMLQVGKLHHLKILNLPHNCLSTIEGLKDLKLLTWLGLSGNRISTIDSLSQNIHLEHLDLSDNKITNISDISYLKNLKALLLHRNLIETLMSCQRFLPSATLNTLTLNDNQLQDLTQLTHLSHLSCIEQLTIANNPAVEQPENERQQFDYRPYVINWCLSLRVLDGMGVGAKESLKAEWMYSQSKGRAFGVGQHKELIEYLVQKCPLHPDDDWEEDKKLNLILSKVQEHQSSLRSNNPSIDSAATSTGLSPRVQQNGSNTLPRASHHSAVSESPVKHGSSFSQRSQIVGPSVPGSNGSRRNSNSGGMQTPCGNVTDSGTPSSTPSVPRRCSVGLDGTTKSNGRGNLSHSSAYSGTGPRRNSYSRTSPSPVRRTSGRTMTPIGTSRYSIEPKSYNLSLPRSLYGDDINGNSHADPMTQSCYVQMSSSDMMSSSVHGGLNNFMMSNSMIMTNDGSILVGDRGRNSGSRSRATAWNEYANTSEGETKSLIMQKQKKPPLTQHDLMTTSLDPVMLMQETSDNSENTPTPDPGLLPPQDSWATSGPNRPNKLFEHGSTNGKSVKSESQSLSGDMSSQTSNNISSSATSDVQINQQIKDIYLQDLSDSELSQSLMYSRLQNRLNPVPESLNSPDIAPPASNDGMTRPPRDDPLRVYNRDIRIAIQKQSLNNKPEKLETSIQSESINRNKSISLSLSRHINDVISSSTEDDEDNRQIRARENGNMIANKNAANIRKGSLASNLKSSMTDNQQMSQHASYTKSISKHSGGNNLNTRNVTTGQRPTSAVQVGLDNSFHSTSKVTGSNSLTNSPRSSSLSNRKKINGITRAASANFSTSPVKSKSDHKTRSKTPDKIGKGGVRDNPKDKNDSDHKFSPYTVSEGNVGDDESCSGRSSRCDETEDGEDLSSAETEGNKIQSSGDINNKRNYRRVQNRKPRNSRKKSIQSPEISNGSNRNSSATRTNIYSHGVNGNRVSNTTSSKVDSGKMLSTPSRKINKKLSSTETTASKYIPEKYASDSSKAESLHSSPRSNNMASSKRTVSSSASAASIYKRPSTARPVSSHKLSNASSSSNNGSSKARPGSAATNHPINSKRPRANTLTSSLINDKSLRNSSSSSEISNLRKAQKEFHEMRPSETSNTQAAATVIQKQWRGHTTRNNDPKVIELKEEVRNLRTEQHIRHLTKELSAAKNALEQERKLRALQMDAIKVLWKEVQMLDPNKYENASNGVGGGINNANNRIRPSGSNGSQISSRSSEHSIAKLMETLEATAGSGTILRSNKTQPTIGIPESSSTLSLSTPATGNITGYITTPSSSDSPVPKSNQYIMAQSMPANVLMNQLGANSANTFEQHTPQALDTLNKTCSNLQNQVEQLQSSLTGVMQFMSAFSSLDVSEMTGNKNRTRHSSSTSTQETLSFAYHNNSIMSASMINPILSEHMSCTNKQVVIDTNLSDQINEVSQKIEVSEIKHDEQNTCSLASSQGIESVESITIKSNALSGSENNTQTLKISIDCDQKDVRKESNVVNSDRPDKASKHHLNVEKISLRPSEESEGESGLATSTENKGVHRPKSPRPKTLPGLNKNGKDSSIPGLAQLAGNALLNSPQAPQQVKAFAKTLVEGLITDSIAAKEDNELSTGIADNLNESHGNLEVGDEHNTTGCDDTTDISFSLATETEDQTIES